MISFCSLIYAQSNNKISISGYGPDKKFAKSKAISMAKNIAAKNNKKISIASELYFKVSNKVWKCQLSVYLHNIKKKNNTTKKSNAERSFISFRKVRWRVDYFYKQTFGSGSVVARIVDKIKMSGSGTYRQNIINGRLVFEHIGPGWASGLALMYIIHNRNAVENIRPVSINPKEDKIEMSNGVVKSFMKLKNKHCKLLPKKQKKWQHYFGVHRGLSKEKEDIVTPYSICSGNNKFSFYAEKDSKKIYTYGNIYNKEKCLIVHTNHKINESGKIYNIVYKTTYSADNKLSIDVLKSDFDSGKINKCISVYKDKLIKAFIKNRNTHNIMDIIIWESRISKDIYNTIWHPYSIRTSRKISKYTFRFGGELVGKSYGKGTVYDYNMIIGGSSGFYPMMVHKIVLGHATLVVVQGKFWGHLTIAY